MEAVTNFDDYREVNVPFVSFSHLLWKEESTHTTIMMVKVPPMSEVLLDPASAMVVNLDTSDFPRNDYFSILYNVAHVAHHHFEPQPSSDSIFIKYNTRPAIATVKLYPRSLTRGIHLQEGPNLPMNNEILLLMMSNPNFIS